jgi:hypothetical protein
VVEKGRSPVLTTPDAWNGGHYDTAFFYPSGSDASAALRAIWSFPAVTDGPGASQLVEPWDQPLEEPLAAQLYGIVALPGGGRVACATFVFDGEQRDEVQFSIPLGSLGEAWPDVGSYPFCVDEARVSLWEPKLEALLVALAEHVFAQAPFWRGLIGFEVDHPDLQDPGDLPATHPGVLDVVGAELVWHPPSSREGFTLIDADG